MSTLVTERDVFAQSVSFSDDSMTVHLDDGRAISVPLTWYPRLLHGTPQERQQYELIGDGQGIHWPALDEDISVEGLLAGRRSAESDASISRWISKRAGSWVRYNLNMTKALEQAIERLRQMPDDRQDSIARLVLHEIEEDERWAKSTEAHSGKLQALVEEISHDAVPEE